MAERTNDVTLLVERDSGAAAPSPEQHLSGVAPARIASISQAASVVRDTTH